MKDQDYSLKVWQEFDKPDVDENGQQQYGEVQQRAVPALKDVGVRTVEHKETLYSVSLISTLHRRRIVTKRAKGHPDEAEVCRRLTKLHRDRLALR